MTCQDSSTDFVGFIKQLACQTVISKVIWRNAARHGILGISGGYADSLAGYAQRYGLAGAMARNLLAINHVSFPPRYFLPGELNPRSIHEKSEDTPAARIFIRPNPASEYLEVVVSHFTGDAMQIDIFSIEGRQMMNARLIDEVTRLDLQDMPSGVYVVKVSGSENGYIETIKFIKTGVR